MIFVFGSNLAGLHGGGAARYAYNHEGAAWGRGIGYHGNSYAIPTKGVIKKTRGAHQIGPPLGIKEIETHVKKFIEFAVNNPDLIFKVTRIGCGLAGFTDAQMAPLFKDAPFNCYFDGAWQEWLGANRNYWGTL